MKIRMAVILAACALVLGTRADAQLGGPAQGGPRGGGFNNNQRTSDAIKTVLDLTDRQFTELNDLRDSHNQKLQDISTQIRDIEKQRRDAMAAGSGAAQVGALALQVQSLQQQMQDENKAWYDAALRILDSGQKEKRQAVEDALKLAPNAGALMQYGLLDTSALQGARNNFLGGNGAQMMMRGGMGMQGPGGQAAPGAAPQSTTPQGR
jgi:Spy/CpxP family protein refolding chaperone